MTYDNLIKLAIWSYVNSLYNLDGRFRNNLGSVLDLESTYYCLAGIYRLTDTSDFIEAIDFYESVTKSIGKRKAFGSRRWPQ